MRNSYFFTAASLVVTSISAMYPAFYVAPKQAILTKKMNIMYSRNGMYVRSKYEN